MIEIQNLVKIYESGKQKVKGVQDVSLTINDGEIFGIVGYSGAGKSTLLRCINMLEWPTSGNVKIDGVDLTSLSRQELRRARQKIGMIFQHFHLVRSKTVFDNVAFALKAAGKSKQEIRNKVDDLLEMVGLQDKRDAYPSQLSGGQKQRVGIARALANDPNVLLCDEATSALDPGTTRQILLLLKKINQELGITIVLITHEMGVVKEICDRIAVMQDGKIIECGEVYELFARPEEPLTRSFIDSVLQLELPEHLVTNRRGTLVRLQYRGEAASDTVISDMLQSFRVKGNIIHGKIEYIQNKPLGILVLELIGDESEVKRAIDFMHERTGGLEVIEHAA